MRRRSAGRFPSSRLPTRGAVAAICGFAAAYLIFVVHYSVNGLLLDDWGFVHLVHAAEHGRLTLGELWAQHNENRMFVPNAMMVGLALVTHDDTRTAMVVSALVFVASYVVFLLVLQTYLGRRLTVVPVLATGVVWFSLADWQNALWGFQFAWYLILFLLMAMLVPAESPYHSNVEARLCLLAQWRLRWPRRTHPLRACSCGPSDCSVCCGPCGEARADGPVEHNGKWWCGSGLQS